MLELKDLVEQTLKELDKKVADDSKNLQLLKQELKIDELLENDNTLFLIKIRERLVVLFEGLQEIKDDTLEAKLEMTLDFLEYLLVDIDKKIEERDI
ncbi:MAG: hypothetical protein DSZ06_01345 [Sulfurospirillum sp.]|nr:MAG: hypothetical protein DSZ06_01345 [Sulfurospirillum sp.]